MRAIVFEQWKQFPVLKEVEKPVPGPGEVLLKVAGAGACHSDVSVFEHFDAEFPGTMKAGFILGHETSGWVDSVGEGVRGVQVGDAYLVYGPVGCGRCRTCSRGLETYCENAASRPYPAIGLGRDGGMAEYLAVPARNLVPLGDADPVAAAPLADAALTPYHAIRGALPHLAGGGKYALVVGLGGLGQIAVQILSALTGSTIIATDMKPEAMAKAEASGAIAVPAGEDQVEKIREITGGRGVDAAFDFVGASPTMAMAAACMAQSSKLVIVGIAGGVHQWSFATTPYESILTNTYWGSLDELHDVVAMYRAGQIRPEIETFTLDTALDAYRKLADGTLNARAVIVPHLES